MCSELGYCHYKFLKQNVETKCLILSCETNRYPVRCQSWPYAEQYKLWFKEVCTLVENFKKDIMHLDILP